jgi:sugar lactone lactonase YvrE
MHGPAALTFLPVSLALSLLVVGPAQVASASTGTPSAGTVRNFGPNLQQAVDGQCRQPEGLTIDPSGNLYVASNSDSATTVGHVCVLDPRGRLTDVIDIPAGAVPAIGLLGELWEDGQLYVLDQADNVAPHGRVLLVNPRTHAVSTVADGFAFPNGIAEDEHGFLYVSDSLQGRVYRIAPESRQVSVWAQSALLQSSDPNLPVGANGIAFDCGHHVLYVTNTGNRQVLRIPVSDDGDAGAVAVFADGAIIDQQAGLPSPTALFGADGIQVDVRGNLYVMANHANEVQVLSPDAQLIHRYSGTGTNALDFDASAVFAGRTLYITNMSAADGGINSKVSTLQAPYPGLPTD